MITILCPRRLKNRQYFRGTEWKFEVNGYNYEAAYKLIMLYITVENSS